MSPRRNIAHDTPVYVLTFWPDAKGNITCRAQVAIHGVPVVAGHSSFTAHLGIPMERLEKYSTRDRYVTLSALLSHVLRGDIGDYTAIPD